MRYILIHITTIIETYKSELPLAHFLKHYFKQHPILGSRDRKMLSALAYSWYRCSKGLPADMKLQVKLQMCLRLCGIEIALPFVSEEALGEASFYLNALFPYETDLSAGITKEAWLASMLVQPNLFIRIRKDKGKAISLLNGAKIPFTFITDNCLSLPNGTKIDEILPSDIYVVQDASSQQTGDYFNAHKNELWYDCCSGAGGKSLLLKDAVPGVRLTITDKRESIIYNLQQRFRQYRHELPVAHITDVADRPQLDKALGTKQFDSIICDVPCSGSGTWARTPEQLYFFDSQSIDRFSLLQQTIATNVCSHLKPGGRLLYITCSVFMQENESVVEAVIQQTGLKLIQSQIINGISIGADSMFIAELQKI